MPAAKMLMNMPARKREEVNSLREKERRKRAVGLGKGDMTGGQGSPGGAAGPLSSRQPL
jgi:hypothetical protein